MVPNTPDSGHSGAVWLQSGCSLGPVPRRRISACRASELRSSSSKYSVVVDVGRDESGKRIRRWHSGYARKKDAERALAEILAQLDSAAYVAPAKPTVERFLTDEWLPTVERTLRPLSYVQYEQGGPDCGSSRASATSACRGSQPVT